MVLLISHSSGVEECARAIEAGIGQPVEVVKTIQQGTSRLRHAEYSAVVVDQAFLDLHPIAAEGLWKHSGMAIPVFVNFAISGVERIVRDVRAALDRRQKEQWNAARAAQTALRNELTGAVAGILLSSELALSQPSLPPAVISKLRSVHELALQIQNRLGGPPMQPAI